MTKNKIIDLFCGCGGLSKGFEMAGFEVEVAIDMWKDAIKTYNHNHKNSVAICEDIHNLNEESLDGIMKKGERVLISPQVTGYADWVEGTIIDVEKNPFVGKVITAKTDNGVIFFEKE